MFPKKYIIIFTVVIILLLISPLILGPIFKKSQDGPKGASLTLWMLFDEEKLWNETLSNYTRSFPNVHIKVRKFSDPKEYETELINALAEGNGPDIFMLKNTWVRKHKNKVLPLTTPTEISYFNTVYPQIAMNDLEGEITYKDAANKTVKEQALFGVPLSIDTLALIVNKSIYRQYIVGRNLPGATWEDLKADTRAITQKDANGLVLGSIAMGDINLRHGVDILHLLFAEAEPAYIDASRSVYAFGQSSVRDAATLWFMFSDASNTLYTWDPARLMSPLPDRDEVGSFAAGKIAMMFGYSYDIMDIKTEIALLKREGKTAIDPSQIAVVEVPVFNPLRKRTIGSYYPLFVSKDSKSPETAWHFLSFIMHTKDLEQSYSKKTLRPPAKTALQTEYVKDPLMAPFAAQINRAESIPMTDEAKYITLMQQFGAVPYPRFTSDISSRLSILGQKAQCLLDQSLGKPQAMNKTCM